ncbi:protein MAINTENANCE OF MERISTEMS-like [Papaver somniferum]|uniref:protein MAINTENANCE OF MERISTEMS-like n=1 Tax=Papaver somniferum TaxID=3469 RepID=UPI000E6F7651|nr:protein MAINTENANCE OF MERISTEMS-like [Papaver somniferum]
MLSRITSRFAQGKKMNNKKRKGKGPMEPEIDPNVGDLEVPDTGFDEDSEDETTPSVVSLDNYNCLEDSDKHASTDITYSSDPKFRYQHRGSLFSVIVYYKEITKHSPKIKYIIDKAGWGRLLAMEIGEASHPVIDYLVERWWDTTHTFHFPFGEMGFTPLDWVVLTGLSIGIGDDVPYNPVKYKFDYVREHVFPEIEEPLDYEDPPISGKKRPPAQWISYAITIKFLTTYFKEDILVAANLDDKLAEKVARAFFMYVLGNFFFSNAKNYIDAAWLAAFEDLNVVDMYDWGGPAFAKLYVALNASGRGQKSLTGPFQILEFWGYEYLGICRPCDPTSEEKWPRTSRWKAKKKTIDIVHCRNALNQLTADIVTWRPWESAIGVLDSDVGRRAVELSNKRVIFTWIGKNMWYLGERSWRQNHPTFGIPRNPPFKIGEVSHEKAKLVKEAGWVDANMFVKAVSYNMYLRYWRHVTNFHQFVTKVDWVVELHGVDGDRVKHLIQRPAQHVPIPPPQQLSYPEAYNLVQEHADFNRAFREFVLYETEDRMIRLKAKDEVIRGLAARNNYLEDQMQFRMQQTPRPPIGFGSFSETIPPAVWAPVSQASTMSSVNPLRE